MKFNTYIQNDRSVNRTISDYQQSIQSNVYRKIENIDNGIMWRYEIVKLTWNYINDYIIENLKI